VLSKIILAILLVLLLSKLGLKTKFRQLKPKLDRAINLTIIGLAVIYVGQLLFWLLKGR